jgi:hypothetical protein
LALIAAPAALAQDTAAKPAAEPAAAAAPPAAAPSEAKPASTEVAKTTAPEPETPHAWELDVFVGYGQLGYPGTDFADVAWSNGDVGVSVDLAYRGPHFTHPYFGLTYVPILASGRDVNVYDPSSPAAGVTQYIKNYAHALGLVIGAGWDIDWFRARAGLGLYDYEIKTYLADATNSVSQVGLGFEVSLTAFVWRPEPFALGVEAQIVALQSPLNGIYQTMWELGITGRWDFVNVK